MSISNIARRLLLTLLFLIAVGATAQAQPADSEYTPEPFQEGKDVVWVPTAQALADKMLNLAKVTSQDYVIDLGSGDGRIVITAAKRGARSLGVEYNPRMVALSKRNAAKEGVGDRVQFIQGDLFEVDLSQATVITMFLLQDINLKLRPRLLKLRPGTRIVSNTFTMNEWEADQSIVVLPEEGCDNKFCEAYLWIVPAQVEGVWKMPQGKLTLRQNFQMISGTLEFDAKTVPITKGKLEGAQITFTAGGITYTGRVNGDSMQGIFKSGRSGSPWSASRVGIASGSR